MPAASSAPVKRWWAEIVAAELTSQYQLFRDEVRTMLAAELTDEMKQATAKTTTVFADRDVALAWQKILHRRGWAGVAWPVEFGGTGWDITQRHIFAQECTRAGAPDLIPLGLRMLAPVLFRYGTKLQQDYYLPKILTGEHYWCQGYSEPSSGSDLASLQMRAVRDGDDYVLDGTKIWTTHAHFADHIFCLVRTDPSARKQAGISFILVEMDRPGVSVKPIVTLAGDHEVNQVFFDAVRVPITHRVGEENDGWSVAKYLLEFERGGGTASTGLWSGLLETETLLDALAKDLTANEMAELRGRAATLQMAITALQQMEDTVLAKLARGQNPGPNSSLLKLLSSNLGQSLAALKMSTLAYYAVPNNNQLMRLGEPGIGTQAASTATAIYLNNRASTIFGGSNEVQKNIIAKTVLGL
ncbi:MAG: acyl-CoA dehydrogenase family protein [SAR86 cluster bacterium]|uniref:Acyl-CoA dehydrogenase family protein n=1 Tax=SAR86 cluster bacterium TaxID=2030880 RepID=A0A972VYR6_9GAMM|nr:acyl-CoA dehydrogenase family protein [SAR86 cluster bacterium]